MAEPRAGELDITELLVENHRRARRYGRSQLLLVASADNCPGCSQLESQLGRADLREQLANETYLVKIKAGDLYRGVAETIRIGDWTLSLPGFPITSSWQVDEDGLSFRALGIGPFDSMDPADGLRDLLEGRSVWVSEAEAAQVVVCREDYCSVLSAQNGFSQEFSVTLVDTP